MTVGSVAPVSRVFNLRMHTRNHIPSDIAVGAKEFRAGSLIEIRQEGASSDSTWIAFEVGACRDDIPKDVISFEQSLATQLRLRPHANILVRPAVPSDHAVSLVELLIKEQYLSQADLWLLATNLGGSCVHVGKLIEFQGMRATVKLMWRQGESLLSGYVSPDPHLTKVVFRSATASISIFILMTREMWRYDLAGDLCFHLVVSGLLTDLCSAWRERGCTHDVTIVMATRVIYDAKDVKDFPNDIRPTIQTNSKCQFYEDIYEVLVQNERFDDWSDTLMALNKSFISFDDRVLRLSRADLPRRRLAFSGEAPILESMNVVLNAMDTHRLDHRFDRTGNALVLISASQGVYDVEKQLKSITKKRVIESGLAVDLVCILPQPFHPVPLFRMFDEHSASALTGEESTPKSPLTFEYALPNDWVNVSFYQASYSSVAFMMTDSADDYEGDDRRAVAVFSIADGENFANPVSIARIDLSDSSSSHGSGRSHRQLLNPFLPLSSTSTFTSVDRDRASRPHANRWLHALPQNELGQPLQIHHSRYRSSTTGSSSSRRNVRQSAVEHSDVLTGVDWKSLILPAVLPNTAAAGQGLDAWLKEACVESPHYVVFQFQDTGDQPPPSSKSAVGFRRPQRPQEVFDLLVLLRLAAGFQLVLSPQQDYAYSTSSSLTKLGEFFKIHRNPPVLMASGRYYQKLELIEADQRVVVTKFVRTKRGISKASSAPVDVNVYKYSFLFRVPDIEQFHVGSTEFTNRRPDLLNLWSSLDYHVTSPTIEFDLNDYSMRECFWKSYFAVLPLLNLPSSSLSNKNHPAVAVIDWSKIIEEIVQPSIHFLAIARLAGYINGLITSRTTSQTTPASTPTDSSTNADKQQIHMVAHLQAGLDSQGLSFVESSSPQTSQIRFYTTYDAVNWLLGAQQQLIYGFDSVDACMNSLNDCLDAGRIFSPSSGKEGRRRKLFYGICYISFVNPSSSAVAHRGDNLVEVAFGKNETLPDEDSVMLSVDASGRGGRHDLAMIVYDSCFQPEYSFRLRLEWLFSSGSFLCELVDSWHHRARSFGLHLLPVPSNAFDLAASDPLRLIIEIPYQPEKVLRMLNLDLEDELNAKQNCKLITDTLLHHFAFIHVALSTSTEHFVHLSGVAFIRQVPGAFEWAWNFQVSRRWQNILENEAGDRLLADFRQLSSNADNSLLELVKLKGVLS